MINMGYGQGVGIGTTSPNSSSMLEIKSTTDGLLIPRMTTTQRKAIASPAAGLLVFDTDKQTIYYFDGEKWTPFLFAVDPDYLPAKKFYYGEVNGGDDQFGESADLNGNYAIVGAPGWEGVTVNQAFDYGKARIYFRNNGSWGEQADITSNNANIGDKFGTSVSITDTWAIIGCPYKSVGANSDEGSVYVFKRNGTTWTQFAELTGSNATTNDNFGYSVSIENDIIVVGAPGDDINIGGNSIVDQGSIYVFEFNGSSWVQRAKLFDPVASLGAKLGFSADVDVNNSGGYYIIGGAPYEDVGSNPQQGTAHVWGSLNDPTTWTLVTKLTSSIAYDDDNFGYSVSVDNQNFGVGAPNYSTTNVGVAFYFKWNGSAWVQHSLPSGSETDDKAGLSVSCYGDKIMTSIPGYNTNSLTNSGIAFVNYSGGSNGLYKSVLDADPQSLSLFGYRVCMSGNNILTINTFGHLQFSNIEE